MDRSLRDAEPYFSQPVRQIVLMLIVVALAATGGLLAFQNLSVVFDANPYLNGFIFMVFGIGIAACFLQVVQLIASIAWIEDFVAALPGHDAIKPPSLLAPLAALLRSRGSRVQINSTSGRSILDSVATRIDEARDITRYLVNLLIFLGLLGTFYGLATTVPAVVETIQSLAPKAGESGMAVFDRLMQGLQKQLGGMGMAFSSSLLGLTGSLLVGLLELFAGHGQNRFYRELEDWLSTITRVGLASGDGEGGEAGVAAQVIDNMAEQMETLQSVFMQSDASRALVDERLGTLAAAVERLARRIEADTGPAAAAASLAGSVAAQTAALTRLAEGQDRLITALEGRPEAASDGVDAESRMRLRSIDVQLLRILEEISAGRTESITDLRGDLAALTAAIRHVSRGAAAPARRE